MSAFRVAEPPTAAHEVARDLAPRLAERAQAHDASGAFPTEDFADLRSRGFLGLMEIGRAHV